MRKRIVTPPLILAAIVLMVSARYIAPFLLWATAAEYWYPPVQNDSDPVGTLTAWIVWLSAFYLLFAALVFAFRALAGRVFAPAGLTRWIEGWESWRVKYEDLKEIFVPMIAKAKGITLKEASQVISDMFPIPEGEKFITLTRDPDAREALRAWRHLTGPTIFGRFNLYGWDKDSRGWNAKRWLRARLWEETITSLDAANVGKYRWIIEISPQAGMVSNTVQAIDLYLTQREYPHLVVGPLKTWNEGNAVAAAVLRRVNAEWWEYESGRNITVVVYMDEKPQKQADD